ncbi:hypothetical protein IWQ62_001041 [Dispira parvispora]|uniref:Uncharacterized protein n=1 Tax=Dispira parvispora TaxID=1520584 RepID=A0A9W8E5E6_9FUNG|nr:hypothetical protein IWQ62_001041 [Dispira parvispora]
MTLRASTLAVATQQAMALPTSVLPPGQGDSTPLPTNWTVLPIVFCYLVTLALACAMIYYFGNRKTMRWYVQGASIVSWYLPFTVMFLLPLDLSSTLYRQCSEAAGRSCRDGPLLYLDETTQLLVWRMVYWTSFCLTWFCLPFLMSFVDSGAFTLRGRLTSALRDNLLYYCFAALAGGTFLAYFAITRGIANFKALAAFVMAAANSWGLVLITIFMGCGLVALPRRFWHAADLKREFHHLECKAVELKDEWFMAEMDLYDLYGQILQVKQRLSIDEKLQRAVAIILKQFPTTAARHPTDSLSTANLPEQIDEKYLVDFHVRVMRALSREARCRAHWEQGLRRALLLQDILASGDNPTRTFESDLPWYRNAPVWRKTLSWWWYLKLQPMAYRIVAMACTGLSIALIWSELTFNVVEPQLSVFAYLMHSLNLGYAALEWISFITMAYMCICAYSVLMNMRLFHFYALAPNHHTNERSLLFCGSYLCRLTIPLCYNFLTLSNEMEYPAFSRFMGVIDLVPFLGDEFNAWFPILILIPVTITLFRVHTRLFKFFDASDPLQDEESGTSIQREEGRLIISEARRTLVRTGTLDGVVGQGGPSARLDAQHRYNSRLNGEQARRRYTRFQRSGSGSQINGRERTGTPRSATPQSSMDMDAPEAELLGTWRRQLRRTQGSSMDQSPGNRTRTEVNQEGGWQKSWRWLREHLPTGRPAPRREASTHQLHDTPSIDPSRGSSLDTHRQTTTTDHSNHRPSDDVVYDWESGQYVRSTQHTSVSMPFS